MVGQLVPETMRRVQKVGNSVILKRAGGGQRRSARLMSMRVNHENPELVHCQETTAGPIFLLVRAAALHDSKVIKVAAASRKRSRDP
jgi:hypothetical protein